MRSSYNPYDDLGARYPHLYYSRAAIAPSRGAIILCHSNVLLDHSLSKTEARCTMAHEIAHLDAGDQDCTGLLADRAETAADLLAARRLMSACQLAEVLRWTNSRSEAAELMDVTPHLLAVRMASLHPAERGYLIRSAQRREHVA